MTREVYRCCMLFLKVKHNEACLEAGRRSLIIGVYVADTFNTPTSYQYSGCGKREAHINWSIMVTH